MRITESRLRRIIRSVIVESMHKEFNRIDMEGDDYSSQIVDVMSGDHVHVLHVDSPYTGHRMDWSGCTGIVTQVDGDVCTIVDPDGELEPLVDQPMNSSYIEII